MKKIIRVFIGLLLLPFVFVFVYNFIPVVIEMLKNYRMTCAFLMGFILYCFFHKYLYNFSRPYVFAHEISHALAAWCCGYKVSDIKVNEESGHTKVSDINTFVLLAPYCLPLYVIVCILCFYTVGLFWKDIFDYNRIFLGLLGFLMAMHLIHTYKTLTETEQSDVSLAGGAIFSFALIAVVNLSLLLLLINFLFPNIISPMALFKNVFVQTVNFWKISFIYLHKLIIWVKNL